VNKTNGFSLVELIVTLVILGIVVGTAIPGFSTWVPHYRLKSTARNVASTMQLARLKAVRENARVVIHFDTTDNSFEAFVDNGRGGGTADDWIRNGDETVVMQGAVPSGVTMIDVSFTLGEKVRFDGRGFVNGLGGHVYLKNVRDSYMGVTLNRVGNPRIVMSTDGGTTWN
jgi:prepilin-type N-terminal cleavage/methylation domain-containing protein